jgi:hypothetical protein
LHSRGDFVNPFELGLALARGIPGARFVELDSRGHIPLSHEPAWQRYVDEVSAFAGETGKDRLSVVTAFDDSLNARRQGGGG